jgi:hypothetical protein
MKNYGYLIVEGQHDIAFISRLLRPFGLKQVNKKSLLDPFWDVLIPKSFPVNDDLQKRVPVPAFFENETRSIAIHPAEGITRLAETLNETLSLINRELLAGYGFFLDADDLSPQEGFEALVNELRRYEVSVPASLKLGEVTNAKPLFGIFVLPDNQNQGTLENILLETAEINYAHLSSAAKAYIESIDSDQFGKHDLDEFKKPAGQKKALLSSMASILKPGKAIQNSIQDNRWLEGESENLPAVKAISTFLMRLFELK